MSRAETCRCKRADTDRHVLGMLGSQPKAIVDFTRRGWRVGTIRSALARLLQEQQVTREWDGNIRYGRYVYGRV